jgi:hypothetical protein
MIAIVDKNGSPPKGGSIFKFLTAVTNSLSQKLKNRNAQVSSLSLSGRKLEDYVFKEMNEQAELHPFKDFANSIVQYSGLKFPDIVVGTIYGVEVKSSQNETWKTTGNSIFEGNRVPKVKDIFILFGKLSGSIEFKYRSYADCIDEVKVTHSPRYTIDMNLKQGETFFDKIGHTYEEFKSCEHQIEIIKEHYKKRFPDKHQWWLEKENAVPVTLTFFNSLDKNRKLCHKICGIIRYPEILGPANCKNDQHYTKKYEQFVTYLLNRHGIICHNVRDIFTAGGKLGSEYGDFQGAPQIFKIFLDHKELFQSIMNKEIEERQLDFDGDTNRMALPPTRNQLLNIWKKKALVHATKIYDKSEKLFNYCFKDFFDES